MKFEPVTVAEVLAFRRERFESSLALVAKKGHDYNRTQQHGGDTLFNLRVCELNGIVDTAERGILVRLSDKFMRLVSLTAEPAIEAAVTDEPVLATVDDIHNYVDYLALLYLKRRAAAVPLGAVLKRSQDRTPDQPCSFCGLTAAALAPIAMQDAQGRYHINCSGDRCPPAGWLPAE